MKAITKTKPIIKPEITNLNDFVQKVFLKPKTTRIPKTEMYQFHLAVKLMNEAPLRREEDIDAFILYVQRMPILVAGFIFRELYKYYEIRFSGHPLWVKYFDKHQDFFILLPAPK